MMLLDLNLLSTFDAIYETRSATLAAKRLGLTQSAVSHALRRLRDAVNDPLFVRGGGTLLPTARAVEMAPGVREGLMLLRKAISRQDFDPATTRRTITISGGSYFCALVAPQLIGWCRSVAPNVHIRLLPFEQTLPAQLDGGSIDLAIGLFDQVPARYGIEALFKDEFVWVAACSHPLAGLVVGREDIDRYPQLIIRSPRPFGFPSDLLSGGGLEMLDITEALQDRDTDRYSGSAYDVQSALLIAGTSDMLARVPRRFAEGPGKAAGVTVLESRERQASFLVSALWHRRADDDRALTWLRDKLASF